MSHRVPGIASAAFSKFLLLEDWKFPEISGFQTRQRRLKKGAQRYQCMCVLLVTCELLGMPPRQTFPAFRTAPWKDVTASAYYKWVLFTQRPFQYIKATLAETPRHGMCCGPVQMPVCKHPREPRPHQQFCVTFLCNCSTRALISLTEGACNSVETRQISGLHHAVVAVAIDDRRKQTCFNCSQVLSGMLTWCLVVDLAFRCSGGVSTGSACT